MCSQSFEFHGYETSNKKTPLVRGFACSRSLTQTPRNCGRRRSPIMRVQLLTCSVYRNKESVVNQSSMPDELQGRVQPPHRPDTHAHPSRLHWQFARQKKQLPFFKWYDSYDIPVSDMAHYSTSKTACESHLFRRPNADVPQAVFHCCRKSLSKRDLIGRIGVTRIDYLFIRVP